MADTCTSTQYNNNSNDQDEEQHSTMNMSMSPPLYELQHVFDQYKSHPELLRLILTSKVEEDKRRTEEAKLRSKELDYYLEHDYAPPLSPPRNSQTNQHQQRKMSIPSRINVNSKRLPDPYTIISHTQKPTTSPVSAPDSNDHQQRRHSAATAMLAMGSSPTSLPAITTDHTSHIYTSDDEMDSSTTINNAYPSPVTENQEENNGTEPGKPRRRREMLAITRIVETRDFPYVDNYFWRNNGNTTQKKTGCRSIYYKCSNSNKGCQVNKTVTAKQNGEYLIKYRGNHMAECGMVERVRDL